MMQASVLWTTLCGLEKLKTVGLYKSIDTRGKSITKKNTSSKACIACGARLLRANAKYAKQYCDEHKRMMDQLRPMRQPCRFVKCKNPAHEDGYCDTHRPFNADHVPMRSEWLDGEGLIKTNNPKCPYYAGNNDGKTYRSAGATENIKAIRVFLNE